MRDDDRNQRDERDLADELDYVDAGELRGNDRWRLSETGNSPSPTDENVDQSKRKTDANRQAGNTSESERSDRTHQAPHEDHVGRADWAVEGSEGGGDPGGSPRRGGSGAGSRSKNNE